METGFPEFSDASRKDLIAEAFDLLQSEELPVTTYAALWLCNVQKLEQIVQTLREDAALSPSSESSVEVRYLRQLLVEPSILLDGLLKPYMSKAQPKSKLSVPVTPAAATPTHPRPPKRQRIEFSSSPAQQSSSILASPTEFQIKRSQKIVEDAIKRDLRCVITGVRPRCLLEVAHIYPFQMSNATSTARDTFWRLLNIFWPEEEVEQWKAEIWTDARSEILQNVITLNVLAHKAWDNCLFALQPIKEFEGKTKLTVRFYLLRKLSFDLGASSRTRSEFLAKPNAPSHLPSDEAEFNLYHNSRGTPFRSGDSITIQTNLPNDLPLPSFRLLTLQWHLCRLASMVGGADILDDGDDDDDDEGRDDWGLAASSLGSQISKIFSSSQPMDSSSSAGDGNDDDDDKTITVSGLSVDEVMD